jgi:hypothetical protein
LLRRQLELELLHALAETFEKVIGLRLILDTRHQVLGTPVPVRVSPAVPPKPALEPDISARVEVDMGKERREHCALRRANLCGLHKPIFHAPRLSHPGDQA